MDFLRSGELRHVEFSDLKEGCNYLIHADGKGDEPHCVSMCVASDSSAAISDGEMAYTHSMQSIREILEAAIDKPILFEYIPMGADASEPSSQNVARDASDSLLYMSAGSASVPIMETLTPRMGKWVILFPSMRACAWG